LRNKVDSDWDNLDDEYNRLSNVQKTGEEKKLSRKLIKFAKNNGVDVINEVKGQNYAVDSDDKGNIEAIDNHVTKRSNIIQQRAKYIPNYKKSKLYKSDINDIKTSMRQRRALQNGRGYINVHGGKSRVGTIGHETFHILGKRKFDLDNSKFEKAKEITKTAPTSRFDALKKSIQIGINNIPRLREEAKASRGSIKWLKQNGASKSLLKSERNRLKKAFGTYTSGMKYRMLTPIAHYKNNSILYDTKYKLSRLTNPTFTVSQGRAINTVYGRGGKF
jgi:hypothetical protein